MTLRFTVDTNILIYAMLGGDRHHDTAVDVLERATRADCVLVLQCFAETFRVLTAKLGLGASEAGGKIAKLRRLMPVTWADPAAFDLAMDVVGRHKISFWDAMIWATAKLAGCRAIVTEDGQDGRDLEGVRYVSPFKSANDPFLRQLLPGFTSSHSAGRPSR